MEEKFKAFGAALFSEVIYEKAIAEDYLASEDFKNQNHLSQLQTILTLFSLVSEYNQLDISVSLLAYEGALETFLIQEINKSCPGNSLPVCSTSELKNKDELSLAAVRFFEDWFSMMDGLPTN